MSSFPDSFDEFPDSVPTESTHPFDDDDNGYTPPPTSDFTDPHGEAEFSSNPAPIYSFESNGDPTANGVFVESDGPILPPPSEMQEEGSALRKWRRQNAIILEQKEKREKEILSQIIEEANDYKVAFHEKRKVTCENNKTNNREKESLFLANQEKFHKEVDNNYWKAIAELIPNEVPTIEKRGKKDKEKKPSIVVIQGPKPGKSTDLSRMRQILVKLKHTTPAHLKVTPPAPSTTTSDDKNGAAAAAAALLKNVDAAATPEAVVAA